VALFPARAGILSVQTGSRARLSSCPIRTGGRETDHSLLSSAEVNTYLVKWRVKSS
jgi:hypothetical protein